MIGKQQAYGLLFSGELLENGGNHNSGYWKIAGRRPTAYGLLFSGELLETGGINNSDYWKIAGLRPAIFRGTLGNWGHPKFELLENSRPTPCYFQWNSWRLLSLCNNRFLFNSCCCYFQQNSQKMLPFPKSDKIQRKNGISTFQPIIIGLQKLKFFE